MSIATARPGCSYCCQSTHNQAACAIRNLGSARVLHATTHTKSVENSARANCTLCCSQLSPNVMLAHRCGAALQLALSRACGGSTELLTLATATCTPSTSKPSTPSHGHPSGHQHCMAACMSTLPAYLPPRHNAKTLKHMVVKTESSVNDEISKSAEPAALMQALRGLKYLAPSIPSALLARLAAVRGKEPGGSWAQGAGGELWAQGVREADVQLHLMEPQHLCHMLWALSQLQQPSSPAAAATAAAAAAGLPPRILAILLHGDGALLALADPRSLAKLATGMKDLKHASTADWQALAGVACRRASSLDQDSKAEIAQALSTALESGADEQLAGAVKQLQAP